MAEVMFEMVALIFQRIECFVLDLPSGAARSDKLPYIVFADFYIRHPAVMVCDLPIIY